MTETRDANEVIATVVAAFAQRSDVGVDDIVALTAKLRETLTNTAETTLVNPVPTQIEAASAARPPVAYEDVVSQDAVTCLVCGKSFKTLKRHLMSAHGLTEAEYRAQYNLPDHIPIVAPSYSEKRAEVATDFGFGKYDRKSADKGAA